MSLKEIIKNAKGMIMYLLIPVGILMSTIAAFLYFLEFIFQHVKIS